MPLFVNTNLAALNAQRHLERSSHSLRSSMERLSSGLRLNDAYDDAAGLAIADKLGRDVRVTNQAIRNANDGLSALAIGEKALGEVNAILTRLSDLASESATGLVSDTQRSSIQNEFSALLSEIDRISLATTFNGVNILSAGTTVPIQVGLDGSTNSQIAFNTGGIGLSTLAASSQASAQSALGILTSAIASVATTRGTLGAYESRLITTISSLRVSAEQFAAAESRIRDADAAAETANLTRASILQQTGVAVLAQANQQPAVALGLLR